MRFRLTCALLATMLVLAGCGGGGSSGGNEDYEALLHGLKQAADSGKPYDAMNRAEDLKPVLRESIEAFCETTQLLLLNREAWKARLGPYLVSRIKVKAERELPFVSTGPVNTAVKRYRGLFGLESFDPAAVRRYKKACYH